MCCDLIAVFVGHLMDEGSATPSSGRTLWPHCSVTNIRSDCATVFAHPSGQLVWRRMGVPASCIVTSLLLSSVA